MKRCIEYAEEYYLKYKLLAYRIEFIQSPLSIGVGHHVKYQFKDGGQDHEDFKNLGASVFNWTTSTGWIEMDEGLV